MLAESQLARTWRVLVTENGRVSTNTTDVGVALVEALLLHLIGGELPGEAAPDRQVDDAAMPSTSARLVTADATVQRLSRPAD